MYLSAGLSGMCMRKEIQGKSDHEKTDPPVGGRAGEQFQKQECEAAYFRTQDREVEYNSMYCGK